MSGIFSQIRSRWQARCARQQLRHLSDAQLSDIGIRRSQIDDLTRALSGVDSGRRLV